MSRKATAVLTHGPTDSLSLQTFELSIAQHTAPHQIAPHITQTYHTSTASPAPPIIQTHHTSTASPAPPITQHRTAPHRRASFLPWDPTLIDSSQKSVIGGTKAPSSRNSTLPCAPVILSFGSSDFSTIWSPVCTSHCTVSLVAQDCREYTKENDCRKPKKKGRGLRVTMVRQKRQCRRFNRVESRSRRCHQSVLRRSEHTHAVEERCRCLAHT